MRRLSTMTDLEINNYSRSPIWPLTMSKALTTKLAIKGTSEIKNVKLFKQPY